MLTRDVLGENPLFGAVLVASELDLLATKVRPVEFPSGGVLMRQDDPGSSMYVLTGGEVAVSIRKPEGESRVATLGAGEMVGEMSLLTGANRTATVAALTHVTALEIDKPALESLLAIAPSLVDNLAETMDKRQAELKRLYRNSQEWRFFGLSKDQLAVRIRGFFKFKPTSTG